MKKTTMVPLSREEIKEINAALWIAKDEGQGEDPEVQDSLIWRFKELDEDENPTNYGGDNCFTGRRLHSANEPEQFSAPIDNLNSDDSGFSFTRIFSD